MPNVVTVKCNFIICYGPYNNKTPDRPFEEIGDSLGIFGMFNGYHILLKLKQKERRIQNHERQIGGNHAVLLNVPNHA